MPLMAKDEANLKRVIGYHKRKYHGIKGKFSTPEVKRIASRERNWKNKGLTFEQIEVLRAKYAAKESAAPMGEPVRKQQRREAEPIGLKECPVCHSRFFVTKGQE